MHILSCRHAVNSVFLMYTSDKTTFISLSVAYKVTPKSFFSETSKQQAVVSLARCERQTQSPSMLANPCRLHVPPVCSSWPGGRQSGYSIVFYRFRCQHLLHITRLACHNFLWNVAIAILRHLSKCHCYRQRSLTMSKRVGEHVLMA